MKAAFATRRLILVTLMGVLGLGAGCALVLFGSGVVLGVGTVAYVKGNLQAAEKVSLDHAWEATLQGVEDLKLSVINSKRDALTGHVVARTSADERIDIMLKWRAPDETEFSIRVGTMGDEALSRQVYFRIKKHF